MDKTLGTRARTWKLTEEQRKKMLGRTPWNKGKKQGYVPVYAFKKGQVPWNKGKSLSIAHRHKLSLSHKGKGGFRGRHSNETKEKLRLYWKNNHKGREYYKSISVKGIQKQQTSKEPTSIEKKVYQELERRGVLFERQKLINGRFLVDVYIPSLNLIIECDGDYWHSLERVKKKDHSENAYLTTCGYKLLRLSEKEIKDNSFKERMVTI